MVRCLKRNLLRCTVTWMQNPLWYLPSPPRSSKKPLSLNAVIFFLKCVIHKCVCLCVFMYYVLVMDRDMDIDCGYCGTIGNVLRQTVCGLGPGTGACSILVCGTGWRAKFKNERWIHKTNCSLTRILDTAARIEEWWRSAQTNNTLSFVHELVKCIEVDGGICEHLLLSVTNLSSQCKKLS